MNSKFFSFFFFIAVILVFSFCNLSFSDDNNPWSEKQLLNPADLAQNLKDNGNSNFFIYNIGPSGSIKNSIDIGPGREKENIEKLRKELSQLPKESNIVIYCGCCPFKNCPNIRPAFNLLNEMKFTNHHLLNLSNNLKTDWIDKGYPMK